MPVLAKEPSLWPAELFDGAGPSEWGGQWQALHVRPRTEKVVARQLLNQRIPFYLPLHERRKKYQRRLVVSHAPLFPGYVFAKADAADVSGILVRQIVRTLQTDEPSHLEHELRQLHALIESGRPVSREERLQPGMPARIISGPLAGMEGQVVRNKDGHRFVLQVQFIQQGASIEVDGASVEAI